MITIKNVRTLDGQIIDLKVTSSVDRNVEANGQLLLLPGLIDPHLSLGAPNQENWTFGIESAVRGGITTILDVPSESSPSESKQEIEQKKMRVEKQLADLKIPLMYFPYAKSNSPYVEELGGQKLFTKGSLLLFTQEDHVLEERQWDRIFQIAAWEDLPVIINSRNENAWHHARFKGPDETLLEKAIYYAERQNTRLYVLNVATRNELDLIQDGRSRALLIYAETTLKHLFPHPSSQVDFLWEALQRGIIETIGSGYHVEGQDQEKLLWHGANFDFLNPIFLIPLLFTAHQDGKITLENIIRLTRVNIYDIFNLERRDDNFVLINLEKEQPVQRISKMHSSEMKLKGWPEYIIVKGHLFQSPVGGYHLSRIE